MYLVDLVLILAATAFTVLMLLSPRARIVFAMLSLVIWFSLSASVTALSVPYEVYSAAENRVVTGVHVVHTGAAYGYLFMGLGFLSFLVVAVIVLEAVTGRPLMGRE